MKVKVSELEGRALNWAVASVLWGKSRPSGNWHCFDTGNPDEPQVIVRELPKAIQDDEYNPSGNWAHFGPMVDTYKIEVSHEEQITVAAGIPDENGHVEWQVGTNAREAGCRAVVAAKYDVVIEIPDELMEVVQ